MDKCRYAFRIVGTPEGGKRRLIDAATAYSAYASCDSQCELQQESYLSSFWYGEEFRKHLSDRKTVKGFDGVCWSPFLWFDIDRENNLEAAHHDTRKLCSYLKTDCHVADAAIEVFFSGGKGFHVGISSALWTPEPSRQYHHRCKSMAAELAAAAGITIDPAIYTLTQPFRAPNSRHRKSGLFKRRLTPMELETMTTADILQAATHPKQFALNTGDHGVNDRLRVVWRRLEIMESGTSARRRLDTLESGTAARRRLDTLESGCGRLCGASSHTTQPAKPLGTSEPSPQTDPATTANVGGTMNIDGGTMATLNRKTIDFIRHGAADGERARRLFSAAANLAEFACPEELAFALLTEAGLDTGLPPSEVKRQILCGLERGRHDE